MGIISCESDSPSCLMNSCSIDPPPSSLRSSRSGARHASHTISSIDLGVLIDLIHAFMFQERFPSSEGAVLGVGLGERS